MGRPRIPNQKSRYGSLNARLNKYVAMVGNLYSSLSSDASRMATDANYDGTEPFSFSHYPQLRQGVKALQEDFKASMKGIIYSGTSAEWKNSNAAQDMIADKALKYYGRKINGERRKIYYQPNNDSLKAFQNRVENGIGLSTKLWEQSENLKKELEYAISSAVEKGVDAVTLSKRVSRYLKDFPSLKKDYQEKFGNAVDCKDCEYRSIRLARSEINMAYRTAEQTRWRQMDFVLGYEIKLSGSHPRTDVCDMLAGKYPKDFVWTGWHPNDLCYVVPILMTEDEFFSDEPSRENEITDVPEGFVMWVGDNRGRIAESTAMGTAPYFVRDNQQYVTDALGRSLQVVASGPVDVLDVPDDVLRKAVMFADSKTGYIGEAYPDDELVYNVRKAAYTLGVRTDALDAILEDYTATRFERDHEICKMLYAGSTSKKHSTMYQLVESMMGRPLSDEQKAIYRAHVFKIREDAQRDFITKAVKGLSYDMRNYGFIEHKSIYKIEHVWPNEMTPHVYWRNVSEMLEKASANARAGGYPDYAEKIDVLLKGGEKVYLMDGGSVTESMRKIRGVRKVMKDQLEYATNLIETPSISNADAEAKMAALMPRKIKIDFTSAGGFGDDELFRTIDAMTMSAYEHFTAFPRIIDSISFIGSNDCQYKRVVDNIVERYMKETDLFRKTFTDPVYRMHAIESIVISGEYEGKTALQYAADMASFAKRSTGKEQLRLERLRYDFIEISKYQEKTYYLGGGKKGNLADRYRIGSSSTYAFSDPVANVLGMKGYNPNVNGVVLNRYFGDDKKWRNSIILDEATGFHPVGTKDVRSIMDHEFGHKIDEQYNITSMHRFKQIPASGKGDISGYPFSNGIDPGRARDMELLAEAWSEFVNSGSPRRYSCSVADMILDLANVDFKEVIKELYRYKIR